MLEGRWNRVRGGKIELYLGGAMELFGGGGQ